MSHLPFELSSAKQDKSLSPSNITLNSAQRTGSNPVASTTVSIRSCPVEKSPSEPTKHDRPHERSGKFAAIVFPIWARICSRRAENLEKWPEVEPFVSSSPSRKFGSDLRPEGKRSLPERCTRFDAAPGTLRKPGKQIISLSLSLLLPF